MALRNVRENTSSSETMAGKVAYVAVSGLDFSAALATGLETAGARVALINDRTCAAFSSRVVVASAFAEAADRLGPADLVVHAAAPPALRRSAALASLSELEFLEADAAQRATLYTFQAAHSQMWDRGGAVVVLGPALSLVGAKNLVPLSMASEGQRSLVKSAARQWGKLRITVNWVAVADGHYAAELAGKGPEVPELGPPTCALGYAPDMQNDIAPILAFFGSSAGRSITGASINLDGGNWMTP